MLTHNTIYDKALFSYYVNTNFLHLACERRDVLTSLDPSNLEIVVPIRRSREPHILQLFAMLKVRELLGLGLRVSIVLRAGDSRKSPDEEAIEKLRRFLHADGNLTISSLRELKEKYREQLALVARESTLGTLEDDEARVYYEDLATILLLGFSAEASGLLVGQVEAGAVEPIMNLLAELNLRNGALVPLYLPELHLFSHKSLRADSALEQLEGEAIAMARRFRNLAGLGAEILVIGGLCGEEPVVVKGRELLAGSTTAVAEVRGVLLNAAECTHRAACEAYRDA